MGQDPLERKTSVATEASPSSLLVHVFKKKEIVRIITNFKKLPKAKV